MRRVLKVAGILTAGAVLLFIGVSLAIYYLIQTGELRQYLISEIEQKTQLKVEVGEAHWEIGTILGISFRDLTVTQSSEARPELSAKRVRARVALWPLLRRRLIFFEIFLESPEVRFARDPGGTRPLLERLLNLPFLKQDDPQFALDVRTVTVSDGEVVFNDNNSDAGRPLTRLHNVALVLERDRGPVLQEYLEHWGVAKPQQSTGSALKFKLHGELDRDGQRAALQAQGKLVFADHSLDLSQAWHDVDVRIGKMPARMAQAYGAKLHQVKVTDGILDGQLRFEGTPQQRMRATGMIKFARLSFDAPEWYGTPINAGDGQLRLDVQWQPGRWDLSRLECRLEDLALGIKGSVWNFPDGVDRLRLDLSAKPISVVALKKYFPARLPAFSKLEPFINGATGGELRVLKAGADVRGATMQAIVDSAIRQGLSFDIELHNVAGVIPGGYPPLRAVNGRIGLDKGRLSFSDWNGISGGTRITDVDGMYNYAPASADAWELRARGKVDLGELRDYERRGLVPAEWTKSLLAVDGLGGTGTFDVTLSDDGTGAPHAQAEIELDSARLQWNKFSFTDIEGTVFVTPGEIKTEAMRALISGSPVELQVTLQNYAADDGRFDVTVESSGVRAGIVSQLLLDNGSVQDPGIVRGSVRYWGALKDQQQRQFTGDLDLINVQLLPPPLLQPLRQLNGKIIIDDNGVDFRNIKTLLVGVPASATGRWYYRRKPQLVFDFVAPNLDIDYLISQIDPEAAEFYANLQAEGRIALGRARLGNFEFADVKSDVLLDRRLWRLPNFAGRAGGGSVSGALTVMHKPDILEVGAEPRVRNVPVSTFLSWFDISDSGIIGTVDVTGKISTEGKDELERKQNLRGAFGLRISDGTIHRLRVVVQILNLLDLSRWFTLQLPDLGKQGIRFRSITGDFEIREGIYSSANLLVDSDDLRMTGAGKIDPPNDDISFIVAVRPFPGIDVAITQIPLLGRGIAAIKNSFLVASFNVSGRIDDPTVVPAPLGTLSEMVWGVLRIPKSLIPFIGDEKQQEKHSAQYSAPVVNR
jgi:uncharacterized protein YhdP